MASPSSLCSSHGFDFPSSSSRADLETVSANVVALVFMVRNVLGAKHYKLHILPHLDWICEGHKKNPVAFDPE